MTLLGSQVEPPGPIALSLSGTGGALSSAQFAIVGLDADGEAQTVNLATAAVGDYETSESWSSITSITPSGAVFTGYSAQASFSDGDTSYNCSCSDTTNYATLAQLRRRMLIQLGFATQADNPPPGVVELFNEFLISSQTFLYEKYQALRNERFFTWTMEPGVRFYDLLENQDECTKRMDALKLTWVGLQDSNGVWLPLIPGIPPEFYTSIDRPGIPTRYEIRQCIEVFPAPDKAYTLRVKAKAQLEAFAADGDKTSIESELVFLWALARGKLYYGKADADAVAAQANQYLGNLVAGQHGTRRYIPGTRQIPALPKPIFLPLQGQDS